MLDHIHSGGVHGSDHGDVAVGARGAHPKVSRFGVVGLRNALRVAAAHHVGVVMPDGGDAVLLVHVSLC